MFKVNDSLTYIDDPYVKNNKFIGKPPDKENLPKYSAIKDKLPQPVWENHQTTIDCYNKAWEIAFSNLKKPNPKSGLVSSFIDTAFNGFTFLWDSSFMTMFGKYASHIFDFQKTLDNFYAKQHRDGFICREICEEKNGEQFHRHDPSSTGPNILAWCEWEYYQITGDQSRIEYVFDPLMAYHRWLKANRTWQSGLYWTSGWGCGMDNLPRHNENEMPDFSHGHMDWVDATIQQVLSAKTLVKMSKLLNRENETAEMQKEADYLTQKVNELLWDNKTSFYYDRWVDGTLSNVKMIGAYWALLADIVPEERVTPFVAHLDNENEFNRPHRAPALSFDHPDYCAEGDYWNGGVWPPTTYMVLKGLEKNGYNKLSYDIGLNHLENVVRVYEKTGTLWENYAPESAAEGKPARKDFVGWSGLSPIAVLFEYVFGIRPDAQNQKIVWYINRPEKHGILKYSFMGNTYNLMCDGYTPGEKPNITVEGTAPVTIELHWDNECEMIQFT